MLTGAGRPDPGEEPECQHITFENGFRGPGGVGHPPTRQCMSVNTRARRCRNCVVGRTADAAAEVGESAQDVEDRANYCSYHYGRSRGVGQGPNPSTAQMGAEVRVANWAGRRRRAFAWMGRPEDDDELMLDDPLHNRRRARGDRNERRRGGYGGRVGGAAMLAPRDREGGVVLRAVVGASLHPWKEFVNPIQPRAFALYVDGAFFPPVARYQNNPPSNHLIARRASEARVQDFNDGVPKRFLVWVGGANEAAQRAAARHALQGNVGAAVAGLAWGQRPHSVVQPALFNAGFRVARRTVPAPQVGGGNTVRRRLCLIRVGPPPAPPAGFRAVRYDGREALHDILGDAAFQGVGFPQEMQRRPLDASARRALVPSPVPADRLPILRAWAAAALAAGGRLVCVAIFR